MPDTDPAPLSGKLVVALEQAVAAPFCTSRLADAGARVIKIERKGAGDFARAYDTAANGESAYFTWLNRGKQTVALDIKAEEDRDILLSMLENADVFIQNLLPGALAKLGLDSATLRRKFPRLVTCDITGYGEDGPMRNAGRTRPHRQRQRRGGRNVRRHGRLDGGSPAFSRIRGSAYAQNRAWAFCHMPLRRFSMSG